ncbi:MAG TPA: T9SS type A sorting domain-containing protein, partial [Rhodothermales bacterium]|nr:T9SS type A sorting domain-containing protein [Rhodothermales bacterium]
NLDSVTRMKQAAREVQAVYDATGFRNLPERPYPAVLQVAPRPVSPAEEVTGQPGNPLLVWEPVPGADAYEVDFVGADNASRIVPTLTTSLRLPTVAEGRVTWRVRGVNESGPGPWSRPYGFTVGVAPLVPGVFEDFLITRNAARPVNPVSYGSFAFNGAGTPRSATLNYPAGRSDRPLPNSQSTLNLDPDGDGIANFGWGIWTFNSSACTVPGLLGAGVCDTFEEWFARVVRNDNATRVGANDFEWRFTGSSIAERAFDGDAPTFMTVPFELWNTGTKPDASDDVRMIPLICEAGCVAGAAQGVFDVGQDHPFSGGTDDPMTDAIYWYMPANTTPGQAGYQAWAAATNNGTNTSTTASDPHLGGEVLARTVIWGWNMRPAAGLRAPRPENGTVFRIEMQKPSTPIPSAPGNGDGALTSRVPLLWQEPAGTTILRRYVELATDEAFAHVVLRDSSATEARLLTPALVPHQTYFWRVRLHLGPGAAAPVGVLTDWSAPWRFTAGTAVGIEGNEPAPEVLTLRALYPSPARAGMVTVRFGTPEPGPVRVRLFDVLGREALRVFEGERPAGWHAATVNAGLLAPGLYVVRVEAGGQAVTRTLVVTG